MSARAAIDAWKVLASRSDLIGKEVVFANGVASCVDRGKIRKISVEGEYFIIESDEIEAAYKAGRGWSPDLKFKIDEERYPCLVGDTIFCDLDDDFRQIRISTVDPVVTTPA